MQTEPMQPQLITIRDFCSRYSVGRTKAYELLNEQKVEARKLGNRTLVVRKSAEDWFDGLPSYLEKLD